MSDAALAGDTSGDLLLGFDIGGTKTAVVLGRPDGTILERRAIASEAERGFASMWARIVAESDRLVEGWGSPRAIGVAIGGPLDSARGIVLAPPNLPGWEAVPLGELLTERYRRPTFVEHDAKAGLLAEWYFGAARGARDAVFLTVGTGLGCGVLVDGHLVRGFNDQAGEVGHWRMARTGPMAYGKRGSWEAFSSGAGLPALARHLMGASAWAAEPTAVELIERAREGDARASRVIRESARRLGSGIALLIDLLDPEVVVLGSLVIRAGDLFLPIIDRTVSRETLPRPRACRIVAAELGSRLGDVAAITVAIHRLREGAASHDPITASP